ncbi:probable Protein ssh-4 [Cephalotrichum gorgonifer]|uniref:Protein SSH4 n=1 Tax=Cephalotrichum gorgonifer TaxID=2041049 RepID=A0AAE8MSI1_9PEZI|nr:probable Protein ssh-4 [Cephalotrichum gorgonifer]
MGSSPDTAGIILVGLISSFVSAGLIALVIVTVYFYRTSSSTGWLDFLTRPGEFDDEQAFIREEAEALENMDDMQRTEYFRAKAFINVNPPESLPTDISLSQYLAIQEKGVSAWEFEPELEIANCFVEARTEIEFFDSECTVMCNLPVPKQNDVYYWEAKIYEKPDDTLIGIGMATKPYPLFRLPGFHKTSIAYLSSGVRRYNQPFEPTRYGLPFVQGDVIGVGYRPRTGTIFFTRNGKKLEDVGHGLKSQNFFPSIGANGPATVHVNLGQSGFVFIEANVKKWGLAPVTGSLAPPPPYGSEQGSILLESGSKDGYTAPTRYQRAHANTHSGVHPYRGGGGAGLGHQHGRSRSGTYRVMPPTSPGPQRSPTDISLAQLVPAEEETGEASGEASGDGEADETVGLGLQDALNPPPDYSSPDSSESGSRRGSVDSENTPLIQIVNRSRQGSSATGSRTGISHPPIPSYSDAVREDATRDEDSGRSSPEEEV